MDPAATRRRRRLLITLTAAGIVLLLLTGVGIYGLLRGTGPSPSAGRGDIPSTAAPHAPIPSATPDGKPGALPMTGDAEVFARGVAEALFTWNTTSGYDPSDYAQPVLDVADGSEADMLASDIRTYVPSPSAWAQLRQYQTRQWITVDTAVVPDAWKTALAQAAPGQLPKGAIAYTITGTRHRTGTWDTDPVETAQPVSFTVFLTCAPAAPEFKGWCRVVRLSELNSPLH
jgi:hypothetical protein